MEIIPRRLLRNKRVKRKGRNFRISPFGLYYFVMIYNPRETPMLRGLKFTG